MIGFDIESKRNGFHVYADLLSEMHENNREWPQSTLCIQRFQRINQKCLCQE